VRKAALKPSPETLRTIHYCWFGGSLPQDVEDRIRRWREFHPDWQIREWNLQNSPVEACAYAQHARQSNAWAYLSDYVRLHALYAYGGVYFDTDVEVLRPFDTLLDEDFHLGYMHNCALGTAVMVSPAKHFLVKGLLHFYEHLRTERMINNNAIFTEYFLGEVSGFRLDGCLWRGPKLTVHPKTAFEQPGLRQRGYSIHLFNRSWSHSPKCGRAEDRAKPGLIFALKRLLRSKLEESRCVYLRQHLRDRYKLPLQVHQLALPVAMPRNSEV
jgi:hypothetical protein